MQQSRSTRVVGVEPAAGDDVRRSLHAGERVTIPVPRTIADGQQTTSPGELNFPIIQRLVDDVVTVTDEEIVAAMVRRVRADEGRARAERGQRAGGRPQWTRAGHRRQAGRRDAVRRERRARPGSPS